ncbi:MAG: DUF389 domain-containing protein [Kofleriaceae bacterium]
MNIPFVAAIQDRCAKTLGLATDHRAVVVAGMMRPRSGDAAGYWLQLLMAAALATLGLALDSAAVVIGAMLIAPLMRPIVELAMGLATGSPSLVFRAGGRAVASVVAVIVASAAIAALLPFHEVTAQLAARTVPSLLDLFVAAACALVGAYATMLSSGDMATTAAGTSIGISLVPPLCTVGYGLAMGNWSMAIGAGLLFTANITGILVVASLVFLLVGFGQVVAAETPPPEQRLADNADMADRLGRHWSMQSQRLGALSRLLLPLLLLAAIYIPLQRAVREMTRRAAIRSQVSKLMADSKARIAQSAVDTSSANVSVRVVLVGSPDDAKEFDAAVRRTLTKLGEAEPRVSVWAVPDSTAMGALEARLDELPPPVVATVKTAVTEEPVPAIAAAVTKAWPAGAGAELLGVWIDASHQPGLHLRLVHTGAPLGAAALTLLAEVIAPGEAVTIDEEAIEPVVATVGEEQRWLVDALDLAARTRPYPSLRVCVTTPPLPVPARPRRPPPDEPAAVVAVRAVLSQAAADDARLEVAVGDRFAATPHRGACPWTAPTAPPAPATPPATATPTVVPASAPTAPTAPSPAP